MSDLRFLRPAPHRTPVFLSSGLCGHIDDSILSAIISLSPDGSSTGGGTYFEHLSFLAQPIQGDGVIFLGKIYHEGKSIRSGSRFILVAFIDRY